MERTLAIIKPDAVRRGLIGKIIDRIEASGTKIITMKTVHMTKKQAEHFYYVHDGKPFFGRLTNFMSSGPCVGLVLEDNNVVSRWREAMGATDCEEALPGTIRGDYCDPGTPMHENIVHGSDSIINAQIEIGRFFEGG